MKEIFVLGKSGEAVERAGAEAARASWVSRIWSKDSSLWKEDPAHRKIIDNALGWLTVASDVRPRIAEIRSLVDLVRSREFSTACLLGMGGSSLCPEVCAETFGTRPGYLKLVVLDTTDPASILNAEKALDLPATLFIVASKSGGTIESSSLQRYFYEKLVRLKGGKAGENFIAITDQGTSLEKLARDLGFLHIFRNPGDIGGRYSALSFFGLVPMALIGLDLDQVLDRAIRMAERCRAAEPSANPGLRLGIALGVLARGGIDKLTLVLAPEIGAFGYWVEQLVAESTGKDGVGILPVEGESLAAVASYEADRVFVRVGLGGRSDPAAEPGLRAVEAAGHPVLKWEIDDPIDLAGEFFLWEFATAVAGAVLRINPFDQPNVQESKDNTQRLIRRFCTGESLEEKLPVASAGALSLFCSAELAARIVRGQGGLQPPLAGFLSLAQARDYVALLAYLERSPAIREQLAGLRRFLRKKLRAATTLGFGPRYLHSTGQLHKGGANNGLFLQITAGDKTDVPIPGEEYSFGTLKKAQAIGDLQSLEKHARRAVRVHIDGDIQAGLSSLGDLLRLL